MQFDYKEYKPNSSLSFLVDCYWSCTSLDQEDKEPEIQRCLPSGMVEWIFHVSGSLSRSVRDKEDFPRTCVVGIMKNPLLWTLKGPSTLFGIRMKPEAVLRVLGTPPAEAINRHYEGEAFWGKRTADITNRILEAADDSARIRLIEDFFFTQPEIASPGNSYLGKALELIRRNPAELRMSRVSEEACICDRQLQRSFKVTLGISPKSYLRIVRFRQSLDLALVHKGSFADIAYTLGYSDPAHFVREFKYFAGETPSSIFPKNNPVSSQAQPLSWYVSQ